MPNVTVPSAHSTTVTLAYDSSANALLAQFVAQAIQNGLGGASVVAAASSSSGSPPPLHGKIGEWVQDTSAPNPTIPKGYDYIVASAASANIVDQNTDAGQAVLVGAGNLTFNASGAGSIIGGGGNESIIIPVSDAGSWDIALGNGNDTIKALGHGNDTINVGSGSDSIMLGAGNSSVTTNGTATITASSGNETVTGNGTTLIYGNSSHLVFVAGGGSTVFGGTGSDSLTGGGGPDVFTGGTGGNNSITAGVGAATLFGGGNGDQLFANGSGAQILFAGAGNETLTGSSVGGGSDTFVGGAGSGSSSTVFADPSDANLFEFIHGSSGGTLDAFGLTSIGQVQVHLAGYASNSLASVASQNNGGGNLNVTLNDGTQITFHNITAPLTNSNFS